MSVMYAPESAYAKEMTKHEAQYSPFGPAGRPYEFRPYPMMLHRAGRPAGGMGIDEIVETRIVDDESQYWIAHGQGFCQTPNQALKIFEKDEFTIAELAAERNFYERRMTAKAQAEANAANAEAGRHLAELPALPVRKRVGRPVKVTKAKES